jgi:hypothetical protein
MTLFVAPVGASTMPLIKLFFGAPHKLLAGFDGDHHQAI